jgi:hypothetical protein
MKYNINDVVLVNNKVLTILDCEKVSEYNVYYFSDGSSLEESQFRILTPPEIINIATRKIFQNLSLYTKDHEAIKSIHQDIKNYLIEKKQKERETNPFYILRKKFLSFIRFF